MSLMIIVQLYTSLLNVITIMLIKLQYEQVLLKLTEIERNSQFIRNYSFVLEDTLGKILYRDMCI